MKTNKFVEGLKGKTAAELQEELVAAKKELFNLRFQNATNQLDNTSRIKEVRNRIQRRPMSLVQGRSRCMEHLTLSEQTRQRSEREEI